MFESLNDRSEDIKMQDQKPAFLHFILGKVLKLGGKFQIKSLFLDFYTRKRGGDQILLLILYVPVCSNNIYKNAMLPIKNSFCRYFSDEKLVYIRILLYLCIRF